MAQILLIDDSADLRAVLAMHLKKAGYQIFESDNGEDGLKVAIEKRPDLILLDIMMPRLDGWQVCRRIKKHPIAGSIPVILLTSMDQQIDRLRGYESGADAYVIKPWDVETLLQSIDTMLASKKTTNS